MGFNEKITALSQRLPDLVDHLQTEEATKNALVMPFIAALGYDVFNPKEVIPEYIADVGMKKGEKVDYAIMHEDEVILLVECKKAGSNLSETEVSQLYRYFSVTKARIAVLTNGVQYRFFSDLEKPNSMDLRPFLELDLANLRPSALAEVKKLAKEDFDLDQMLSAANELKYTSEIKKIITSQVDQPDEELVKIFYSRANPGARFTASAKEFFTPLVSKAFQQLISEEVNARLRSALQSESTTDDSATEPPSDTVEEISPKDGIVTTEEELEAFQIVRAVVCRVVSPDRVVHRDTKSYMGVLLDDNNRKPICRFWFNTKQKYLGIFDGEKNETRVQLDQLTDIFLHAEKLVETVETYES